MMAILVFMIHLEIGRLRVSNMTGSGLPQRGVERCSNCDVCLVACAFSANSASTSEQDNEKFQKFSFFCEACAKDHQITNGNSLEGAIIWCSGCNLAVDLDNSHVCYECEIPNDPYGGFCTDCWNSKTLDYYERNEGESLSEMHNDC